MYVAERKPFVGGLSPSAMTRKVYHPVSTGAWFGELTIPGGALLR
jgi:hypothetical protein